MKTYNETYGRFTERTRAADGSITTEGKVWPESKANKAIAEHQVKVQAGQAEADLAPTFDRQITAVFHEAETFEEVSSLSGSEVVGVTIWNRGAVLKQQVALRDLVDDDSFELPEGAVDMTQYIAAPTEGRRKQTPQEKAFNLLKKAGLVTGSSGIAEFQDLLALFNQQNAAVGASQSTE